MITAVVYAESGGTQKTTVTANLGVALERMGLDTLLVDLDSQEANLTSVFDVDYPHDDPSADNLVKHLLDMSDGKLTDLIKTTDEGVDILPAHDMHGSFPKHLVRKINLETELKNIDREEYPKYELMYDLFWNQAELQHQYDAILVDPNARAQDLLYNAIYALRTLVAPVEPAGKGSLSLTGLSNLVENLEDHLGVSVGLSCVVPTNVGDLNSNKIYTKQLAESTGYSVPVIIGERESMMDEMWGDAGGSAFKVIEERWEVVDELDENGEVVYRQGTRRVRDYEVETLRKFYELAWFIATDTFDLDADPILQLDVQGRDSIEIDIRENTPLEVVKA